MAKAKALFKRHWKEFAPTMEHFNDTSLTIRGMLYAACIIAEAIRQDMDELDDPNRPGYATQAWPPKES